MLKFMFGFLPYNFILLFLNLVAIRLLYYLVYFGVLDFFIFLLQINISLVYGLRVLLHSMNKFYNRDVFVRKISKLKVASLIFDIKIWVAVESSSSFPAP